MLQLLLREDFVFDRISILKISSCLENNSINIQLNFKLLVIYFLFKSKYTKSIWSKTGFVLIFVFAFPYIVDILNNTENFLLKPKNTT